MKRIIVTDTHLGVKQGSPLYNDVNIKLFTQICEYAEEHYCEGIIHLGDFFDNRKSINIKVILKALQIIEMLTTTFTEVKLLVGNHDTIYKDDIHNTLLSMFERYQDEIIVDRPEKVFGDILLVPWLFNKEILKNDYKCDTLMGHFEMNGVAMNEAGSVMEGSSLSTGDFKNFKKVYSGHFHTPGKYGNIQYLGSPFHTSFSDVDGKRGFYAHDTDTQEMEFIEFDDYPKFRRIKDTDDPKEVAGLVPGNIVELIFTEDHGINGNLEIIERVKGWQPLTLAPKYVNINESMSQEDIKEEDIEIKDHLGILQEYFDQSEQPEHIKPLMLAKMAEAIYKETIND